MSKLLSGFLDLLKAPIKILSQNGKLMASIAIVYLTLYPISFILFTLSINPFILDLMVKSIDIVSTPPGSPDFAQLLISVLNDIGFSLGIEAAYFVLLFFVALFVQTAVIIISSCYYTGDNLSLKQLILKVSKTWTRPFITSLLIQLISLGYTTFFLLPFLVPSLILFVHRVILIPVLIFISIIFITLYFYLSVVWSLGIVVSVVEDSYGFSALAKAKELVKGKRVEAFVLNIFIFLVMMVVSIIGSKLSPMMPIVVVVIQTLLFGVMGMFLLMAYCGLYFQCRNELTKSGGLEYSRIPTTRVVDEYLP